MGTNRAIFAMRAYEPMNIIRQIEAGAGTQPDLHLLALIRKADDNLLILLDQLREAVSNSERSSQNDFNTAERGRFGFLEIQFLMRRGNSRSRITI